MGQARASDVDVSASVVGFWGLGFIGFIGFRVQVLGFRGLQL